jgi:hypothetical protein
LLLLCFQGPAAFLLSSPEIQGHLATVSVPQLVSDGYLSLPSSSASSASASVSACLGPFQWFLGHLPQAQHHCVPWGPALLLRGFGGVRMVPLGSLPLFFSLIVMVKSCCCSSTLCRCP